MRKLSLMRIRLLYKWIHNLTERYLVKWNISVARGKENEVIPCVAASERGRGQTEFRFGVVGLQYGLKIDSRIGWEAKSQRVIIPYTKLIFYLVVSWVGRDTWNPAWIHPDHWVSLNTSLSPIEHSTVRERWKEPRDGSEIEPETISLQGVRAH